MGGKSTTQSTQANLDPATQARINQVWNATNAEAKNAVPGVDPSVLQALQGFQNAGNAGNLGLSALSGNQQAYNQLSNPYQQNVLDAMQNNWKNLYSNTTNAINDQATQAGAFGGSRQGVAQGVALANMNQDQAQQMANLQYQGYNSTMGQAQGLAQLGQAGNQQAASLGDYLRQVQMAQNPTQHAYDIYNQSIRGLPYGQSTSATSSQGGMGDTLGSIIGLVGSVLGGLI